MRHGLVMVESTSDDTDGLHHYHTITVQGGLIARERYRIRVSAVNQAGFVGPPSTRCCHKPAASDTGNNSYHFLSPLAIKLAMM